MKALWAGRNLITLMRLLAAVYLVTLTACGKDDEKTEPETNAQFNSLWTDVFATRCGSCHGVSNTDTLNGPDMRTQDAFHSGLVNKKGTDYPDWDTFQTNRVDCLNIPFISPGNPSQSLIVAIFDDSVTPCNVKSHREPPQSISMTESQLATLKSWITNGAAR